MSLFKKLGSALGRQSYAVPPAGGVAITRSSVVLYSSSGTITPPAGAKLMRVAAIGAGAKGGAANANGGGGGGGCAVSKIVPAAPITATMGSGVNTVATATTAVFGGRTLTGGGASTVTGGVATGGDYNFNGGNARAGYASGAGSAGPAGTGGSVGVGGATNTPAISDTGWMIGGGSCGYVDAGNTQQQSGSGPGMPGDYNAAISGNISYGITTFGQVISTTNGSAGFPGGGGAVGGYTGGDGAVVVEWYF